MSDNGYGDLFDVPTLIPFLNIPGLQFMAAEFDEHGRIIMRYTEDVQEFLNHRPHRISILGKETWRDIQGIRDWCVERYGAPKSSFKVNVRDFVMYAEAICPDDTWVMTVTDLHFKSLSDALLFKLSYTNE